MKNVGSNNIGNMCGLWSLNCYTKLKGMPQTKRKMINCKKKVKKMQIKHAKKHNAISLKLRALLRYLQTSIIIYWIDIWTQGAITWNPISQTIECWKKVWHISYLSIKSCASKLISSGTCGQGILQFRILSKIVYRNK